MANKHAQTLADLHDTKQALAASEKRSRKATRKLRDMENALKPILLKMKNWAATETLDDEMNAPRLATIGDCRRIMKALENEAPEAAEPEEEQSIAA